MERRQSASVILHGAQAPCLWFSAVLIRKSAFIRGKALLFPMTRDDGDDVISAISLVGCRGAVVCATIHHHSRSSKPCPKVITFPTSPRTTFLIGSTNSVRVPKPLTWLAPFPKAVSFMQGPAGNM